MPVKNKFIPYDPSLKDKAKINRKNPTYAEKKFWFDILKIGPFDKYIFNRQKPILDYIVDFYCSKLNLVIEIDGDRHGEREKADIIRTEALKKYGIRILRYNNSDILNNIEGVYNNLLNNIKAI